jgi:hypothetical protein
MNITDHGTWEIYEPTKVPRDLVGHRVMFCRRVSDGKDWYEFQKEIQNNNIKITVDSDNTVQATHRDASMCFPAGMRLLEVEADIDHETLRQKVFDGTRFLAARPPVDIAKITLLATLKQYGLEEGDLRRLAKMAKTYKE